MKLPTFQQRLIEREKEMNDPIHYQTLFRELTEKNLWATFFQEWMKGCGALIQTMGERKISLAKLKEYSQVLSEEQKVSLFEGFKIARSNLPVESYKTLSFRQMNSIDYFLLSLFEENPLAYAFFDWYKQQPSCFVDKENKSYRKNFLEECVMTDKPYVIKWCGEIWNNYAHGLVTPLCKKAIWHNKYDALLEMTKVFHFSNNTAELLVAAVSRQDVKAVKILLPVSNVRKNGSQALSQAATPKHRNHDEDKQLEILSLLAPKSNCLEAFERASIDGKEKLVPFLSDKHIKSLSSNEALVAKIPSLMKRVIEFYTQDELHQSQHSKRKM